MTKYILHGGFTSTDNELNRTFYAEITRDVPDGGTILLCYFASEDTDNSAKFEQDSQRMTAQSGGKHFTFLLADEENFVEQLSRAHALYIRGGSTPKLLDVLHTYGNLKEKLDGKTVVGSSAGAYVIGKYSPFHGDEPGANVRAGMGWLPLRVVTHYESPDIPPNPEALALLSETAPALDLVLLCDFEWRVVEAS